jgi:hypothetical protein
MRRPRIETLEKRQMFAADNLSDVVAAYVLGNCPNWFMDSNSPPIVGELHNKLAGEPAANVDGIDAEIGAPASLGKMHLEDISLGITESVDAGMPITAGTILGYSWSVSQTGLTAPTAGELDAHPNLAHTERIGALGFSWGISQTGTMVFGPRTNDTYHVTDIADGTSNTMMFATKAGGEVVAGLLANDTGGTQGIIAILIGLRVDPSDQGGKNASLTFADRSADSIDGDAPGGAALVGSDEFFERLSDTMLDGDALVASTYGRGVTSLYDILISSIRGGNAAAQITHDVEFEKWADASQFDRGQQASSFYDLLISSYRQQAAGNPAGAPGRTIVEVNSILHEDNEFSFPRM